MDKKILTIDIGASKIRVQLVDEKGIFSLEDYTPLINVELNNEKLTKLLIEKIEPYLNNENKISAISIGVPGFIEHREDGERIIRNTPNIKNIGELGLIKKLSTKFNLPIFLLNDGDAGVLGEWWLGSGKNLKNIIYLTLSTGVGSGLIINDKLKLNSELGHMALNIEGQEQICSCGEKNHAESYLGTEGLARIYADIFNEDFIKLTIDNKHLLSPKMRMGVEQGNSQWLKVYKNYIGYLNIFLENLLAKYHPEIIILGGGIAYGNKALLHDIRKEFEKEIILESAKFENSVNLGLAKYALDQNAILTKN